MSKDVFWAVKSTHFGFYCGTALLRREMIAKHIDGMWRFHPTNSQGYDPLTKAQKEDWERCRRNGDRVVKVRLEEIP